MLKLVQDIVTDPLFGIVWGLIGFFIGNRLSVDRDKRKEFNNLVEPVRIAFMRAKGHPTSDIKEFTNVNIALIRERLPLWRRKGFDKAVEAYRKSKGDENRDPDGMGGFIYRDNERILRMIENLLKYLTTK